MTFTYTPGAVDDVTRVRFWTGDTDSASAMWSNEEITMVVSEEGDYQGAVIALLEAALVKIGREPDMTADWLRVNWQNSTKTLEARLLNLKRKWGKGYKRTASVKKVTRRAADE